MVKEISEIERITLWAGIYDLDYQLVLANVCSTIWIHWGIYEDADNAKVALVMDGNDEGNGGSEPSGNRIAWAAQGS